MRSTYAFFVLLMCCIRLNAQTSISGVINIYAKVTSIDKCQNTLTVSSATGFAKGDSVMLIQMKGLTIDSSNTSLFGSIKNYNSAGNYELNEVASISGTQVRLKSKIKRDYSIQDFVQLVRVPVYTDAKVTGKLTAAAWNGSTGGVLALIVQGQLELAAYVDATGQGFRQGNKIDGYSSGWGTTNYYMSLSTGNGAEKGEGAAKLYATTYQAGRGAIANGAGGGNAVNCGGGGGGNYGKGGKGGAEVSYGPGPNNKNGGLGGYSLTYSNSDNKIFLGGGGGGAHGDNGNATNGAPGGGIIFISAKKLQNNGYKIVSDGTPSIASSGNDGSGGAGAGGTILLNIPTYLTSINIEAIGGAGANNTSSGSQCHAPGGGGGGGVIWFSTASAPSNVTTNVNGGTAGLITNSSSSCYNTNYDATAGSIGGLLYNLHPPKSIDTIFLYAGKDAAICKGGSIQLNALGDSGTYSWTPNSGLNNSHIRNPIATPQKTTTYIVSLSIGSCIYADTLVISVDSLNLLASADEDSVCKGDMVQLKAVGAKKYTWHPGAGLSDSTIANPKAWPMKTTTYMVVGSNTVCQDTAYITVKVKSPKFAKTSSDIFICKGSTVQLSASGGLSYHWYPAKGLSNDTIPNPKVTVDTNTQYKVIVSNGNCWDSAFVQVHVGSIQAKVSKDTSVCWGTSFQLFASGGQRYHWYPSLGLSNDTVPDPILTANKDTTYKVVVKSDACIDSAFVRVSLHNIKATVSNDTTICEGQGVQLKASGGNSYLWYPSIGLSDSTSATPMAKPKATTTYIVKVYDPNSPCAAYDSVKIVVLPVHISLSKDTVVCPNSSLTISANGADKYLWLSKAGVIESDPTQPSVTISPKTTGYYYLYAQTKNGCQVKDSVLISLRQLRANLNKDTSICQGSTLTLFSLDKGKYSWSDSTGNILSEKDTFNYRADSNTTLIMTLDSPCILRDTFRIKVIDLPHILSKDTSICSAKSINLYAIGSESYLWSTGDTSDHISVQPNINTIYWVKLKSPCGLFTDSITVSLLPNDSCDKTKDSSWLKPYNIFSPNGDSYNEYFNYNYHGIVHFHILIFNRWGQQMYESNDITTPWDGMYHGKEAAEATYFYLIDADGVDGKKYTLEGTLMLVR